MVELAHQSRRIVDIVGDSHTMFFKADIPAFRRMGYGRRPRFLPRVKQVNAASLTGVRKYASTLRLKSVIEQKAQSATHLVIALGQVDLELGFYHRHISKGETWERRDFIEFLAEIYQGLLKDISGGAVK